MKDKELNEAAKRMLDLIDSGTTSMTSEDIAPYYVDIKTYTDNEIFELEPRDIYVLLIVRPLSLGSPNES